LIGAPATKNRIIFNADNFDDEGEKMIATGDFYFLLHLHLRKFKKKQKS